MKISTKTTHYLREMLRLILKENSVQLSGKPYLQTHGTAMGRKTAVSFANIFMAYIGTQILSKTAFKPTVWKHYIADDIFLPLGKSKSDIVAEFLRTSKLHHPTLILNSRPKYLYRSDTETVILVTVVYTKAQDSIKKLSLMSKHIFNKTKTFQYTHFTSCRPQSFNGFALQTPLKQLLRKLFQFQKRLMGRLPRQFERKAPIRNKLKDSPRS